MGKIRWTTFFDLPKDPTQYVDRLESKFGKRVPYALGDLPENEYERDEKV
jgi:hypothetical protein